METEGNIQTPAKAGGKLKPGYLIAILIFSLILIIGLVVLIVFNNSSNNEQEKEEGEVACDDMTDEYEMRICLSQGEYNDESGDRYDAMLEESFKNGNYDLFNELIHDRSTDLALDNQCDKSIDWLESIEKEYIGNAPILTQYAFYVSGLDTVMECGNEEKGAYYRNKIDEVLDNEEYYKAITEEEKLDEGVSNEGEDDEE